MARNIGADGSTVYRAVIQCTSRKGDTWTRHEGPYSKAGNARARVTFWSNYLGRTGGSATGRVEQAVTVWRPVGEQTAAPAELVEPPLRDRAERELAAAKAEAEGLAETMRNTDRLTTEDRERTRRSLAEARRLRDEACGALDAQQLALSQALGLGTSAPWDAITERARELHALTETAGTAVSASDVLVRHDVTRKAMCDALGVGYHLNWQQIIDAAQRSHAANAEWQREAERHRHTLAVVLDLDAGTEWPTIVKQAGAARAYRADWARCADEAERSARADVAAARQAEELAGKRLTERHNQLADAVGQPISTSWRDLITAAFRAYRAADLLANAEQERQAARQGEAEAVRARQAADERATEAETGQTRFRHEYEALLERWRQACAELATIKATLRDTETQLGEARQRAADARPALDQPAEAEEREQPAEAPLRGLDLTGYTAGTQAFITAYVRAVALDQVARALGITTDRRR